jgi:hypothetical protein
MYFDTAVLFISHDTDSGLSQCMQITGNHLHMLRALYTYALLVHSALACDLMIWNYRPYGILAAGMHRHKPQ